MLTVPRAALAASVLLGAAIDAVTAASAPQAYPFKPLDDVPIIDPETACNNLLTTIPALLANASSTHYTEPMTLEYPIVKLYANGDNPSTKDLYAGIPEPVLAPARQSLSAIIESAGDWTREQIISDERYGLEDDTQAILGGLPAFCRFGASIITSNSSSTWFETWLPLPAVYTPNVTTSAASSPLTTSATPSTLSMTAFSSSTGSASSASLDTSNNGFSSTGMSKRGHHPAKSTASTSLASSGESKASTQAASSTRGKSSNLDSSSSESLTQASSTSATSVLPSNSESISKASTSTSAAPTSTATSGRAPPDNWQGRLVYVGSGGQRGSVSYPDMKQILTRYRQATASSNLGHFGSGSGTAWTIGDPEAQIDFAYRGTHAANLASQLVVQQFYGVEGHSYVGGEGGRVSGTHKHTSHSRRGGSGSKSRKLASGAIPHFGFPAYYAGCSTGGRQGMAEANRYPYDFNGILAGSPAVYYNNLNAYQIHVNSFQNDTTSPRYIDERLYLVIHDAILAQCDGIDGIQDAVIENPSLCEPNLQVLLCAPPNATSTSATSTSPLSSASTALLSATLSLNTLTATDSVSSSIERRAKHATDSSATASATTSASASTSAPTSTSTSPITYAPEGLCLTQPQIDNLKDIYETYRYPSGELIHEPVEYGSETVWTVTDGVVGKPFPPAPGWFQYQVLNETDSTDDFDYYKEVTFDVIREGEIANPAGTNTNDANFNEYFARGGKLIHYHGLADQLVPSGSSKRFYRSVKKDFDYGRVGQDLSDLYRFFTVPGMGHCRGGDGAWNFGGASQTVTGARPYKYDTLHDMMLALWAWTEDGTTPTHIDGASYNVASLGDSEPKDYVTSPDQYQGYPNGLKFTHRLCPYPRQAILIEGEYPYAANSQYCGYV